MMSLSHLFYTAIFKSKKTMKNIYTSVKKLVIHNYLRRPQPSRMTSSFFNSVIFHRHSLNPNPNRHTQTLQFSTKSTLNNNDTNGDTTAVTTNQPPLSPAPEKRTFAMATGELFLGLAAKLIKSSNGGEGDVEGQKVRMFSDEMRYVKKDNYFWNMLRRSKEVEVEEEEIGVVVDDGDVVWEQRLKDVEAERGRKKVTSPGFSFSAAGLLFPYHLGVAKFLIENGYIKDTTPLAGSSAGAIVCAVVASGATMEEALQATKVLAEDCRSRGTAFRLGAVLREVLEQFLPEDAHIRSNGRVRVAVTQILWRPRGLLVDQFDSREDLINAVITSSFIPGYLAPRPAILFRNRLCVDGGLTLFMPPTSAARTIRVCAFPAGRLGLEDIGISPDCNPDNRASPRELFNWALEPAADSILDNLFELGYMDAAVWAELNPVKDLVQEDNPLVRQ